MMDLKDFITFDPQTQNGKDLPETPGNYLVTIRDINALPTFGYTIEAPTYRGQHLIYTGVAGTSIRGRVWKNHFCGNAGHSTLRLTLGILLGFTPIPRDKKNPNNGHVRFVLEEERQLRSWMTENLLFHYLPNEAPKSLESELIGNLNPPLNLDENYNPVNWEFRNTLRTLRNRKPWQK